jgi:hypothetical protein
MAPLAQAQPFQPIDTSAPAQPFQPPAMAQPLGQPAPAPPPKSKKKLIIIICAIAGVLIAGGVALLIFLLNNGPSRTATETLKEFTTLTVDGDFDKLQSLMICRDTKETLSDDMMAYLKEVGESSIDASTPEEGKALAMLIINKAIDQNKDVLESGKSEIMLEDLDDISFWGITSLIKKGNSYYMGVDCSKLNAEMGEKSDSESKTDVQSKNDIQRKEDVSRFMTAVANYQANNRGALPDFEDEHLNPYGACTLNSDGDSFYPNSFCSRYLTVENSAFENPDGEYYVIEAANSYDSDFPTVVSYPLALEDGQITIEEDSYGIDYGEYGDYRYYTIYVVYGATCDGEYAVAATGSRKFAALHKPEQGGMICQNN